MPSFSQDRPRDSAKTSDAETHFEFGDRNYVIEKDAIAWQCDGIFLVKLPDGQFVEVTSWQKTMPPVPIVTAVTRQLAKDERFLEAKVA